MAEKIIKRAFYSVLDYDLEEEFLTDMHRKGYKFVDLDGANKYIFEETEPANYIYKLDFPKTFESEDDKEDYLQMFIDNGWEYLDERFGYTYFRKEAGENENLDIFSDNQSKKDVIKRVFWHKIFPVLFLFLIVMMPEISDKINGVSSFWGGFFDGATTVLSLFYVAFFIRFVTGYIRIMKKLNK